MQLRSADNEICQAGQEEVGTSQNIGQAGYEEAHRYALIFCSLDVTKPDLKNLVGQLTNQEEEGTLQNIGQAGQEEVGAGPKYRAKNSLFKPKLVLKINSSQSSPYEDTGASEQ